MAKRIVEETLANGEKRYCVQSNTLFGIPCWWSTMTILTDSDVSTSAEFSSLPRCAKHRKLSITKDGKKNRI